MENPGRKETGFRIASQLSLREGEGSEDVAPAGLRGILNREASTQANEGNQGGFFTRSLSCWHLQDGLLKLDGMGTHTRSLLVLLFLVALRPIQARSQYSDIQLWTTVFEFYVRFFQENDANRDGKFTFVEWFVAWGRYFDQEDPTAAAEQSIHQFVQADLNHDRVVTFREMAGLDLPGGASLERGLNALVVQMATSHAWYYRGFCFADENGNGVFDEAERPQANFTFDLWRVVDTNPKSLIWNAEALSDSNGFVDFFTDDGVITDGGPCIAAATCPGHNSTGLCTTGIVCTAKFVVLQRNLKQSSLKNGKGIPEFFSDPPNKRFPSGTFAEPVPKFWAQTSPAVQALGKTGQSGRASYFDLSTASLSLFYITAKNCSNGTTGSKAPPEMNVTANKTVAVQDLDNCYGDFELPSIVGTTFEDVDLDGIYNASVDNPVFGISVSLGLNCNNTNCTSKASTSNSASNCTGKGTTTQADRYALSKSPDGIYTFAQIVPSGLGDPEGPQPVCLWVELSQRRLTTNYFNGTMTAPRVGGPGGNGSVFGDSASNPIRVYLTGGEIEYGLVNDSMYKNLTGLVRRRLLYDFNDTNLNLPTFERNGVPLSNHKAVFNVDLILGFKVPPTPSPTRSRTQTRTPSRTRSRSPRPERTERPGFSFPPIPSFSRTASRSPSYSPPYYEYDSKNNKYQRNSWGASSASGGWNSWGNQQVGDAYGTKTQQTSGAKSSFGSGGTMYGAVGAALLPAAGSGAALLPGTSQQGCGLQMTEVCRNRLGMSCCLARVPGYPPRDQETCYDPSSAGCVPHDRLPGLWVVCGPGQVACQDGQCCAGPAPSSALWGGLSSLWSGWGAPSYQPADQSTCSLACSVSTCHSGERCCPHSLQLGLSHDVCISLSHVCVEVEKAPFKACTVCGAAEPVACFIGSQIQCFPVGHFCL
eukprot:g72401.t1